MTEHIVHRRKVFTLSRTELIVVEKNDNNEVWVKLAGYEETPIVIYSDEPDKIKVRVWDSRHNHDTDDYEPQEFEYTPFKIND